jgi:hypothetical protein
LQRRRDTSRCKLVALSLFRRLRPKYEGAEPPGINTTVTLTPKGGLKFRIRELS